MSNKLNSPLTAGLLFGTSAFGMGMLYLPAAYFQLGYMGMLIMSAVMFLISWFSLYCLNGAEGVCEDGNKHDYSYFARFSSKLSLGISVAFLASNFAVIYLFLRRATDLTVALLGEITTIENRATIRFMVLTLYTLAAFSFFIKRDLSMLKPLSYVSLFAGFYYSALMVICGIGSKNKLSELNAFAWNDGLDAFLNFLFAGHCQFAFLDFLSTLKEKNVKNGKKLMTIGLLVIYVIYTIVGFFGYKFLGESIGTNYILGVVLDDFSDNVLYTHNNVFPKAVMKVLLLLLTGLFVVIFFTNIPLTVFAFLPELEKIMFKCNVKVKRLYTCIGVAVVMWALAIPTKLKEQLILGLFSAFFTNFLSFGFPGMYGLYYLKDKRFKPLCIMLVGLSTLIAIANVTFMLYKKATTGEF